MVLIGSAYPGSDQKTFHSLPCLVFFTSEGREPKALLRQAAVAGKWPWVYPGPFFDSLLCGGVFHVVRGDRKSTRLNSSHRIASRMPSSA